MSGSQYVLAKITFEKLILRLSALGCYDKQERECNS